MWRALVAALVCAHSAAASEIVLGDGNCTTPTAVDTGGWTWRELVDACHRAQSLNGSDGVVGRSWYPVGTSSHKSHQTDAILAPMVTLGLGCLIRHVLAYTGIPIPYTVNLLLLGAMLGGALRAFFIYQFDELQAGTCPPNNPMWSDIFQRSVATLGNMDPHLLLHIFIPPLVFESAFAIEWHLFDQLKWPTLLLAGPGVIASASSRGRIRTRTPRRSAPQA